MAKRLKPIISNQSDLVQDTLVPHIKNTNKPLSETVFTTNRGTERSVKDVKTTDYSISLEDHDHAIKYYFENTIKPIVIQNEKQIPVPIIYGTPEKWKSVQVDGFYRDHNGKIMAPVIMYKRDRVSKNRDLGNKLDGNKVHNYQVFQQSFNKKNRYDKFSILNNITPNKELHLSVIPDYVTLLYSCIIFTDYVEQINKIIEAINYASDSYWGDMNRFKFRATIDSFVTSTEISDNDGRAVKATFEILLQGYIIPDSINKSISSNKLSYSKSQVVFNFETTTSDLQKARTVSLPIVKGGVQSTTIFEGGGNIDIEQMQSSFNNDNDYNQSIIFEGGNNVNINITGGITNLDTEYLSVSISKNASSVSNNTATFIASFLYKPEGSTLPETSQSNFVFYINGQFISQNHIISFIDNGVGECILTINTSTLGYILENTDEIIAIGKFE